MFYLLENKQIFDDKSAYITTNGYNLCKSDGNLFMSKDNLTFSGIELGAINRESPILEDLIEVGDLIKTIDLEGVEEVRQIGGYDNHLSASTHLRLIKNTHCEIWAIYKKIDKDYICVWERENNE